MNQQIEPFAWILSCILLMLELGLGLWTPSILLSVFLLFEDDQRCYRKYTARRIIANLPPMDLPFFSDLYCTLKLKRIKQHKCNGNRTRWMIKKRRLREKRRRMRKRMRARNPTIRMIQGSMNYPLTYKTLKENEKINRNIGKWQL